MTSEEKARRIARRLQSLLADTLPREYCFPYYYRWREIEEAIICELGAVEEEGRPSPQPSSASPQQESGIDY